MLRNLPIIGGYGQQRYKQFNPSDTANFYLVTDQNGKRGRAMYPTLGRRHVQFLMQNKLIFSIEPRGMFRSVNYWYAVDGNTIYRIDQFFNKVAISGGLVVSQSGFIDCDYLVVGSITFVGFTDGLKMYVYREDTGSFTVVTDANGPSLPKYIATFGNRFVVSQSLSSQFFLTEVNLGGGAYDPATVFTIAGNSVFASENGIIGQLGVLHNTLYILCDFTTGVWSNIPSNIVASDGTTTTFPWKKNTTYDFDYGIAFPETLSISFGLMTWVAQSREGLLQVVSTSGQPPQPISDKAIDVLFQARTNAINVDPSLASNMLGFLYEYENTIFYRLTSGVYSDTQLLDQITPTAFSLEFIFEEEEWHRVIELNGERNRVQRHVFFGNRHLVSVFEDNTVYEMSGRFTTNEITNPNSTTVLDAYTAEPFRYERVTKIITIADVEDNATGYAEFITDYVEIDFAWGISTTVRSPGPFENTKFIVAEEKAADGSPIFMVAEDNQTFIVVENSNIPTINAMTYWNFFKPHIELYYSNNGGVSYYPADVLQFSDAGFYEWRMRWYELGTSRNRVYKLIIVSPAPIVVLGATHMVRRSSGGAE